MGAKEACFFRTAGLGMAIVNVQVSCIRSDHRSLDSAEPSDQTEPGELRPSSGVPSRRVGELK